MKNIILYPAEWLTPILFEKKDNTYFIELEPLESCSDEDDEDYGGRDNGDEDNRDLAGHSAGLAHLGFVVDDVDSMTERLIAKGYEIDVAGAEHPHRKTFYFRDPAGFQFEFMQYLSDVPEEKNLYGGETSNVSRPKKSSWLQVDDSIDLTPTPRRKNHE